MEIVKIDFASTNMYDKALIVISKNDTRMKQNDLFALRILCN